MDKLQKKILPEVFNIMPEKNKITENKAEKKENLSRSKQLVESAKTFIFSPTFNVIALVVMLLSVFGGLRILQTRNVQAQIEFVERGGFKTSEDEESENRNLPSPEIFKGEVYDTSIRLRETGALGMAISLAFFAETSEKGSVPKNLDTIWRFIQERNLMPPGLKISNGEIVSPTSIFQVRFQSNPFRFEILSRPNQSRTSPAILLRFPLKSMDGRTITYFQSPAAKRFDTPLPFAPLERIVSNGWTLEQWRGELMPKQENSLNLLAEEKRLLKENGANR